MARPLRVLYVFTARKRGLLARAGRLEEPDTLLFGLNHMAGLGVDAAFHEPDYGHAGRAIARQVGRLGPDVLQLRVLPQLPRYDVVFLTGAWPLLLAAQAIPRRRRPKLVWLNMTLTNLLRRGGPRAALVGQAVRRADRVVCVARFQQRFLQETLGLPAERLPLALSGTDAAFFNPAVSLHPLSPATSALPGAEGAEGALPLPLEEGRGVGAAAGSPDAGSHPPLPHTGRRQRAEGGARHAPGGGMPHVLAAGRDAGRDYATLIDAAAGRDLPLRLVCSPRNLAGLSVPERVVARYDISPRELRREYAGAAAVAVPTQGDASTAGSDCSGTLVLLDTLSMGKPAVIVERAAVHDYITCGREALCVPPGDAGALGDALRGLLDDRTRAAELARAGRERVLSGLTTRHFAARLAGVFREVMG
jgi:glycosyltransferase involved in cell wall biosynthesis